MNILNRSLEYINNLINLIFVNNNYIYLICIILDLCL